MHVVIRTYHGKSANQLFELLENHQAEIQTLIGSIEGLASYTLARNKTGGFSVTVCQNKRGINKSITIARKFIAKHAPEMSLAAMHVFEGSVITHIQ